MAGKAVVTRTPKNWLGTLLGLADEVVEEVNTEFTQQQCQNRKNELEQEIRRLDDLHSQILNQGQEAETSISQIEESLKKSFEYSRTKLARVERQCTTIAEKYLQQKLTLGNVDKERISRVTQIILHLKDFALYAIPTMEHPKHVKSILTNIFSQSGGISPRRVITALRLFANAYVEQDVVQSLDTSACRRADFQTFVTNVHLLLDRGLVLASENLAKGDISKIDRAVRTVLTQPEIKSATNDGFRFEADW